jgi:hypothetical protein
VTRLAIHDSRIPGSGVRRGQPMDHVVGCGQAHGAPEGDWGSVLRPSHRLSAAALGAQMRVATGQQALCHCRPCSVLCSAMWPLRIGVVAVWWVAVCGHWAEYKTVLYKTGMAMGAARGRSDVQRPMPLNSGLQESRCE